MADKEQSLIVLDSWEGGYSNNSRDPGGETYGGISRRMWPNWAGWSVIDQKKLIHGGHIPWSMKFADLDNLVSDFYTDNFWNKQSFSLLNNQDVCNKIFQHYVNMGDRAIKISQNIVFNGIWIDGKLGIHTSSKLNEINSSFFLETYCYQLSEYYTELISEHPQLEYARHEWMLRAKTIGKRPS